MNLLPGPRAEMIEAMLQVVFRFAPRAITIGEALQRAERAVDVICALPPRHGATAPPREEYPDAVQRAE